MFLVHKMNQGIIIGWARKARDLIFPSDNDEIHFRLCVVVVCSDATRGTILLKCGTEYVLWTQNITGVREWENWLSPFKSGCLKFSNDNMFSMAKRTHELITQIKSGNYTISLNTIFVITFTNKRAATQTFVINWVNVA